MLTREDTWKICKKHVIACGVPDDEVWGTTVFYHSTVRGLYITKDREGLWRHDILRDKFSPEGLELLFQILDETMPSVFHRYEHECARQSITPEQWANEARLRGFEETIGV